MHMAQWEAMPQKFYSGKKFFVQIPTAHTRGGMFDEKPREATLVTLDNYKGKTFEVVAVPEESKESFRKDFLASLRDIAGVPLERVSRFVDLPLAKQAQESHLQYYQTQLFLNDKFTLTPTAVFEEILNYEFMTKLIHKGPFALHVDLALSQDSAGIAISHVIGSKGQDQTYFPIYGVSGAAKATPPVIGEIDLKRLGQLVVEISKYLELLAVTMDRFQSAYLSQVCRLNQIQTNIVSVDRSTAPYDTFNYALKDERIYLPPSDALNEELASLYQDNVKGAIDHDKLGSKDMSDAIAASIYTLSQQKSSYRNLGPPKPLEAFVPRNLISDRPSTGREPMY
jgi:hypothetical protein